jgi:hypothetical protein
LAARLRYNAACAAYNIPTLRRQCLEQRIATEQQLVSQIAPGNASAMPHQARTSWMFTAEKARAKIGRTYPEPLIAPKSHAKES